MMDLNYYSSDLRIKTPRKSVKYDDTFGSCLEQKDVTALFAKLIAIREQMIKDAEQLANTE